MKRIKSIIICINILTTLTLFSQKKEILVLDSVTNKPVDGVNIFYSEITEGTFTNADGKAEINLKEFDLKISHINYEEKTIAYKDLENTTTILIKLKTNLLDEVIVSSFNLKKALNYVLENYESLYVNEPFEKECIFKESLTVNGNLKRFILSKVNWWGNSYKVKFTDDLKLRLASIDFNKNIAMDIFTDSEKENSPSKSGNIATSNLIAVIYLNTTLTNFLKYSEGLNSIVEASPPNQIIVSFETDWSKVKNGSEKCKGKITFDKETKAIIAFMIAVDKNDEIIKGLTSISKKQYSIENTDSVSDYVFAKGINNKWTLNSAEIKANVDIIYNNKTYKNSVTNNILVLKEISVKKVNNKGLIDLTKPIFESLPSSEITNANSILLSEEEKKFIYGK